MARKIMTLGEILVEIMADEVGQSFRHPGLLRGPFSSGAPAIFIDQVGKLDCPAGMIGCVGEDDFGYLNTDRLKADGVDVSGITRLPDATTGSAFVTYHKDGNRDFIFNITNSASARIAPEHVTDKAMEGCKHFHVMGSSLFSASIVEAMKKAVDMVKRNGGTVSFDPNIRKEILGAPGMRDALVHFLRQADIFLPSGHEVTMLVDATTEAEAVAQLLAVGVKEIVIKRGAEGATYIDSKQRLEAAPIAVTEIDPTGAGDCFGAAYVACRTLGLPAIDALRFANAAGARAVTQRGPMEGASTFKQLRETLALRHGDGV
jgi:tagatose kinase